MDENGSVPQVWSLFFDYSFILELSKIFHIENGKFLMNDIHNCHDNHDNFLKLIVQQFLH